MRALHLKIPPVAVTLICASIMWGTSELLPGAAWHLPGAVFVAIAIALAGGIIAVSGVFAFRRHSTTVNPMKPETTESVVTDGIYSLTRNPMYLGLAMALVGWGVWLTNMAALLVLPLFVGYMTQFQIKPEERALLQKFGHVYAEYMAEVRRWV